MRVNIYADEMTDCIELISRRRPGAYVVGAARVSRTGVTRL